MTKVLVWMWVCKCHIFLSIKGISGCNWIVSSLANVICKVLLRLLVPGSTHRWEIPEFLSLNEEISLPIAFSFPVWLGWNKAYPQVMCSSYFPHSPLAFWGFPEFLPLRTGRWEPAQLGAVLYCEYMVPRKQWCIRQLNEVLEVVAWPVLIRANCEKQWRVSRCSLAPSVFNGCATFCGLWRSQSLLSCCRSVPRFDLLEE